MTKPTQAQIEAAHLIKVMRGHAAWIRNYQINPRTYSVPTCSAETFERVAEVLAALNAAAEVGEQMVTIYFCRGCGMMLRHEVGTAVCDNCGNDQDPIEGKFAHDQAIALSDVA